jgi:hypothetical protein
MQQQDVSHQPWRLTRSQRVFLMAGIGLAVSVLVAALLIVLR